jgi:thioredoxin-dependent peroxiredoxin
VSYDTPAENASFRATEGFPYALLSDPDRAVATAYDVLRPADHPYPDFPKRITYLIDPDGIIARAYEVTDVATHPDDVLADLRHLNGANLRASRHGDTCL